jgi:hypothetical protein
MNSTIRWDDYVDEALENLYKLTSKEQEPQSPGWESNTIFESISSHTASCPGSQK